MKNEMMQDYSLPCTTVRYHIQASVLFSLKKAELQGAAPRPLSCAGSSPCSTASFLRAGYSTTQVNMCSPFQELISWFKKITSPLSGGKSLFKFPILLDRKERSLRGQCRAKTQIQSFELLPEGGSFNSRGILRRFTWEAGCYKGGENPLSLCTLQPYSG